MILYKLFTYRNHNSITMRYYLICTFYKQTKCKVKLIFIYEQTKKSIELTKTFIKSINRVETLTR